MIGAMSDASGRGPPLMIGQWRPKTAGPIKVADVDYCLWFRAESVAWRGPPGAEHLRSDRDPLRPRHLTAPKKT